jgi:glutathione S-transferase
MPMILGYWDIRGLAQPARLMLEHCGEQYEDKKYSCGPAPNFDRSSWLNEKFTLGLDFPNLPYLVDGDIKISQSNAVYRYIARKHNLCGTTEKEQALVDMCADQIMDMRNAAVRHFYAKNPPNKDDYAKNVQTTLKAFDTFLAEKPWLCGQEITFPDFHFYEMLDQHKLYLPGCLKDFPKLEAYTKRFEELPKIKAYMASNRFMKSPVNNKMAVWTG